MTFSVFQAIISYQNDTAGDFLQESSLRICSIFKTAPVKILASPLEIREPITVLTFQNPLSFSGTHPH